MRSACVAFRHVGGTFHVPGQDVPDGPSSSHGRIKRVDGSARHTERTVYAFFFEYENCSIDCLHFRHLDYSSESPRAKLIRGIDVN
jgi:hypothetical protein